jgi:phosphate uptake regulator
MSLEPKDLELVERIVYKNADDIAVSISRSFERLEERLDGAESRIYSRISDLENYVDNMKQELIDMVADFKDEMRAMRVVQEEEYEEA